MKRNSSLARALSYTSRHIPALVLAVILYGVSVFCTLRIPVYIGRAIDLLSDLGSMDLGAIVSCLKICAVYAASNGISMWLANLLSGRVVSSVVEEVRNDAFANLQRLPVSYLDSHPSGDTASRIISDADIFTDGLLLGFSNLLTGVATIIGTLICMWRLNFWIALSVVLLTPMSFLLTRLISRNTHDLFARQAVQRGVESSFLDETIGNQKLVKAFCREDERIETFRAIDDELVEYSRKGTFFSSLVNPSTRVVNNTVYACVALVGGFACISGAGGLTVGNLSSLLSYASQYGKPFNEITSVITELQNALTSAQRLFELIDEKPETPDVPEPVKLSGIKGDIALDDVFFSYNKDRKLIQNFTLSALAGSHIAVVGPTGCGKTTVINLLMRFYDADAGRISIDGTNIMDLTRNDLRSCFGMVLQDTWLKTASIMENLRFGRSGATDDEVYEACRLTEADSFISRLPEGYDTIISSESSTLSEGQKQLLCITRVVLALPPMLILDEATSSIDTRTELKVQRALEMLMNGRTSIIVAHRLSTIRNADLIVVMKDGKIVETGKHEELLKNRDLYYSIYSSQFEAARE
ncbi:MAG: ABC transporter ATP-binding protein [Oscillospiraceae bacterium]|nr:ABC transporter ATP-binding protein [Oscillospiraceae bacterium]